jgi:hypothetical protein
MGTKRSCLGACSLEGLMFCCGGYDGASCLSSVERLDPLTGVWTSCPAMSTRRRYCRVAVLGMTYLPVLYHRIGRVLSFFSSPRSWDSPNPSPADECPPPPRFWGERHTRWRQRGRESPNSDEGTYTVVLFIYTYTLCTVHSLSVTNFVKGVRCKVARM